MNYRRYLIKSAEITLRILAIAGLLCSTSNAAQDYSAENSRKTGHSHRLYRHVILSLPDAAIANAEGLSVYLAQNDRELSNARDRWKHLSPEQKRKYREKLKRWKQLTPEQKAKIKNRYERFKNLPPESAIR